MFIHDQHTQHASLSHRDVDEQLHHQRLRDASARIAQLGKTTPISPDDAAALVRIDELLGDVNASTAHDMLQYAAERNDELRRRIDELERELEPIAAETAALDEKRTRLHQDVLKQQDAFLRLKTQFTERKRKEQQRQERRQRGLASEDESETLDFRRLREEFQKRESLLKQRRMLLERQTRDRRQLRELKNAVDTQLVGAMALEKAHGEREEDLRRQVQSQVGEHEMRGWEIV